MRILFLTDNFPPEVNAPANRTFEHCREWVRAGKQVTVITCAPNFPAGKVFPGYHNRLWQKEQLEGIEVIRVWTYIAANKGFLKRTLDYISFAATASLAGLFTRADIIVATSPQFFTSLAGAFLGLLKGRPWVFEVRDIWPESIKAVGAIKDGALLRWLERLELLLYRNSDAIVLVTESFKGKLAARGIDERKMAVVKNGVNVELFHPVAADLPLKEQLGLSGCFVVSYIGTLGMAHGMDSIIRAAARLPSASPVRLLLIGDGAERANLERLKNELNAHAVLLIPPVRHEDIPKYMSLSDAALVHLKSSDTFKEVLPSKIFEAAAMRVPILLGVDGEARTLVERYNAGIFFEPENEQSFLAAVNRLREDNALYSTLQAGGERLASDFDRTAMASELLGVFRRLTESSPSSNRQGT